jgi:hypothetical protein
MELLRGHDHIRMLTDSIVRRSRQGPRIGRKSGAFVVLTQSRDGGLA